VGLPVFFCDPDMKEVVPMSGALMSDGPSPEQMANALDDLSAMGFPPEVIEVLTLLTHVDDVPYMDYVREIAGNETAKKVKIADLRHNSDVSRLDIVDEWTEKRNKKYSEALGILGAKQ